MYSGAHWSLGAGEVLVPVCVGQGPAHWMLGKAAVCLWRRGPPWTVFVGMAEASWKCLSPVCMRLRLPAGSWVGLDLQPSG